MNSADPTITTAQLTPLLATLLDRLGFAPSKKTALEAVALGQQTLVGQF